MRNVTIALTTPPRAGAIGAPMPRIGFRDSARAAVQGDVWPLGRLRRSTG